MKLALLLIFAGVLGAQVPTVIGVCPGTIPQIGGPAVFAVSNGQTCLQSPVTTIPTVHFGNDGSQLSSYVPGKSMFVRDLFFSRVNLSTYQAAFKAAAINTVEGGFYIPIGTSFPNEAAWQKQFDGSHAGILEAINDGFLNILTGDDIARGSTATYDACCGPSASWSPNPLTYAFGWLKSLGKVIGVEMVDEISSQFATPSVVGQLGAPGGPQQVSCVTTTAPQSLCTVTWPSSIVLENGALQFLIIGATSNANLNRAVPNVYSMNGQFSIQNKGFTFNATGVGTQVFTAATDPGLVFQMYATSQLGFGVTGKDFIHNDAITNIMSFISAAGPVNVTWPAAALAPPANFQAWSSPPFANYSDLYFTYLTCSGTSAGLPLCLPSDAKAAFDYAWTRKAAYAQQGKPLLMETSDYGLSYIIVGSPTAVTNFDGNTITFSQPHGITTPTVGLTRLSVTGNSNTALNGNYYAYSAPGANSLQVYAANPTGPSAAGGTITFADGQVLNLAIFPTLGSISPTLFQMNGGETCVHTANFNTMATVSASTNAAYNGKWYILPASFNSFDVNGCPTAPPGTTPGGAWNIRMRQLVTTTPGAGGTAALIADNYYHAGVSTLTQNGATPDITAANIMYAAERGSSGDRVYMFGDDANKNQALSNCFSNCATHIDPNPLFNGPLAQASWQGLSNAFNLIATIEPVLLQPQLPAPNYGPNMVTTVRASNLGNLLLMTWFGNTSTTLSVDLSPYNPSGGVGTEYMMNGEQSTQQAISGLSTQLTLGPAQTAAFVFPGH